MRHFRFWYLLAAGLLQVIALPAASPPPHTDSVVVDVRHTMDDLLREEDTDGDHKISVHDLFVRGTHRGDRRFTLVPIRGTPMEIAGTYHLSNLLQELALLRDARQDTGSISLNKIFEPPVRRISRQIRELYWSGLTRRIDEEGMLRIVTDEKRTTAHKTMPVYVPHDDDQARAYFSAVSTSHPAWNLRVVRLPSPITPDYVRSIDDTPGILTLGLRRNAAGALEGIPFVVPGGRFNEMYGWDSYFILLGLLSDGEVDRARDIVDNMVYEITHYGAVLNANRTYYLTRSQPPFLTSMARAVYERLPRDPGNRAWLRGVLVAAMREYRDVWMNRDRLTWTGLSRYHDAGQGVPSEVEPGHFDAVFSRFARRASMPKDEFEKAYRAGRLSVPDLDAYFEHDRSMRESGHDTSNRLEGCAADLVTVDLNALLYKIETDCADILHGEFADTLRIDGGTPETSAAWKGKASLRRERMMRYLWNERHGAFFDYDVTHRSQRRYVCATAFYPLWAGMVSRAEADRIVSFALPLLEQPGGIAACDEQSRGPISPDHPQRQWDYPFGWAPHQIITWQGLLRYGRDADAQRLITKWLFMMTLNAVQFQGTIPEKFDVVRQSHEVYAEYGNVGTAFAYITREGFGWTNASYQIGCSLLPPAILERLNDLCPPAWIVPE